MFQVPLTVLSKPLSALVEYLIEGYEDDISKVGAELEIVLKTWDLYNILWPRRSLVRSYFLFLYEIFTLFISLKQVRIDVDDFFVVDLFYRHLFFLPTSFLIHVLVSTCILSFY